MEKEKKNRPNQPEDEPTEKLKYETARELGLEDDLAAGGDELTVREAGKIGGNMTRKLVEKGKESLAKETETDVGP